MRNLFIVASAFVMGLCLVAAIASFLLLAFVH